MLRACVATAARAKWCSAERPRSWARFSRPFLRWHMGGHDGEQMALARGMGSRTSWGTHQVISEWGRLVPGRSLLQQQLDGAIVWTKDPSHLSEGGPNSWHGECSAGMENSRCGDALSRAKRPKPPVLALIVRERKKTVISTSVFVFSGS